MKGVLKRRKMRKRKGESAEGSNEGRGVTRGGKGREAEGGRQERQGLCISLLYKDIPISEGQTKLETRAHTPKGERQREEGKKQGHLHCLPLRKLSWEI